MISALIRQLCFRGVLWHRGDFSQLNYIREFEKAQFFDPEQIRQIQFIRLQKLLSHAYQSCPFYRQRFKNSGIFPKDIRSIEDLRFIPYLEKHDLQINHGQMVDVNECPHNLIKNQTGGSSGTPVSFFVTRNRFQSRSAATIRHNRWASWEIGDKVAILWGASSDRIPKTWFSWLRQRILDRQLFLDAGLLTEDILLAYYHRLKKFQPKIMLAYARAAVLFAQFHLVHHLPPIRLQAIVTSGEVLTDEERHLLEQVFGCHVFNRYGSREFSVIASECPAHDGLHVMAEGLIVEIERNNKPVPTGELGAILVTDLLNYGMPLIRYRIGDVASWLGGRCSCGRGLPRIGKIAGRVTDFLVGSDGRVVSGAFLTIAIVAQRVSLGQIQILQEFPGAVTYRIKPGPSFSRESDLPYLIQSTKKFLGPDTRVEWEFVSEILPQKSGKFLFSSSKVVPEFLRPATSDRLSSPVPKDGFLTGSS